MKVVTFAFVIFCTSNAISKSAMDLRWRIPIQRGNKRKIRAPKKSSGVAKRRSDKVVLLCRQTKINIERSSGYVKIDVCPWE